MKYKVDIIFCKTLLQAQLFAQKVMSDQEAYFWVIKDFDLFYFDISPAKALAQTKVFLEPKLKKKSNVRQSIFLGSKKTLKEFLRFD